MRNRIAFYYKGCGATTSTLKLTPPALPASPYLCSMISYQSFIPADFAPQSRVWIYQSSRAFTPAETVGINEVLRQFTANWQSHGAPVKGFATVLYDHFILIMADEAETGVSGCSTDSSVRIIRQLEEQYNTNLFNRQLLAFYTNEGITLVPLPQLKTALAEGRITETSLYFNNLADTKATLLSNWLMPLNESWLAARLGSVGVK
jgi:hypothetical protein